MHVFLDPLRIQCQNTLSFTTEQETRCAEGITLEIQILFRKLELPTQLTLVFAVPTETTQKRFSVCPSETGFKLQLR